MRRAVVELVGAGLAVVGEGIVDRVPSRPAIVGALDELAEPATRLRGVEPVRVGRRGGDVVDLPARKVRTVDGPVAPRLIGGEDKGALAGPDEYAHASH